MRWTAKRKQEIILSVEEKPARAQMILSANDISTEEFDQWVTLHNKHGVKGLKTTMLQNFRLSKKSWL